MRMTAMLAVEIFPLGASNDNAEMQVQLGIAAVVICAADGGNGIDPPVLGATLRFV